MQEGTLDTGILSGIMLLGRRMFWCFLCVCVVCMSSRHGVSIDMLFVILELYGSTW